MRAVLSNLFDDLMSSLWFVPSLMVAAAIVLSFALVEVDRRLFPEFTGKVFFVFGGEPDAARDILSVISGSLITVAAVAFSVTLVVIQSAASQFSPRLLRNFTSDLGNQIVLGTYIATFVYALLVMRQIRVASDNQTAFVPELALTAGIIFALVSLALLVYFIHHTVQSIDVTSIINHVRTDTDDELQRMFPSELGDVPTAAPDFAETAIKSPERFGTHERSIVSSVSGYLRQIDESSLLAFTDQDIQLVRVTMFIGDYVPRGGTLALVRSQVPLSDEKAAEAENSFIVSVSRTMHQDPLFGIRQIVDIALKALSTGINDPTTAEQCIAPLGDLMSQLAPKEFPSPLRVGRGGSYLLVNRPTFADFVEQSFSQIRRAARNDTSVTCFLLKTLEELLFRVKTDDQTDAVRNQVWEVLKGLEVSSISESDKSMIRASAEAILLLPK